MVNTIIRLAPGKTAFYDSESNIILNLKNKEAIVPQAAATSGLLRAVAAGKIIVVSGTLTPGTFSLKESDNMQLKTYNSVFKKEESVIEHIEPVVQEVKIETINYEVEHEFVEPSVVEGYHIEREIIIEEVVEEATEEIIEEVKKEAKKKGKKKKGEAKEE